MTTMIVPTVPAVQEICTSVEGPAWATLTGYRKYIEERLCWVHGIATHASHGTQRQCPYCRVKWNYQHRSTRFRAMFEFCRGATAAEIGRVIGCAKNTALAYFRDFSEAVEEVVTDRLAAGGIATNPVCGVELQHLVRALRTGRRKMRARACRHLFLNGLGYEERAEALFQKMLLPDMRQGRLDLSP